MANRPVFAVLDKKPYVETFNVEFKWNGGFAISQKQKNIAAIHSAYAEAHQDNKILEISSKSFQEGGRELSAFHLEKYVPSLNKKIPIECVFQGSKKLSNGMVLTSLYENTPREAKRTASEMMSYGARIVGFDFEGIDYPTEPKTAFYDYMYISALLENPTVAEILLQYDAFTDIEFDPKKSINCQAKAAALYVSLFRQGLLEKVKEFEAFIEVY